MKKNSDRIPLMFRAQVEGRCQIQRLPTAKKQAEQWTEEWIEGVDENIPKFSKNVQTREYQITWRFITNSGQDETVTRPVIGAKGFPWYPGSSMKGAFLRACPPEDKIRYCGGQQGNETKPGILRFHGGYPQDLNWIKRDLVDVVHPQQEWQTQTINTKNKPKGESAFVQISLYQPHLVFGISSPENLSEEEWEKIWNIWEQALAQGIGSRVSAGYGQAKLKHENRLFSVYLKGQGLAPKLINDTGEFRANMFKAALRGHTLRLFGGVTDAKTAEKLTKELWGGFAGKNGAMVGQLGIAFDAIDLRINDFTYTPNQNPFQMPVYELAHGRLDLLVMGNLSEKKQKNLKKIATRLIKFTLLLGGFSKSWRRADHRLFFPDYLENGNKPMIGCHWEFIEESKKFYCPVESLSDITNLLNEIHENIKKWVTLKKKTLKEGGCNWREAFSPLKVQVWGRIAENKLDSKAIYWFHKNYQNDKTIKQSSLTGRLNQIGRIWHRMYPRYIHQDGENKRTINYVELLTIFPDNSQKTQEFLNYLNSSSEFEQVW